MARQLCKCRVFQANSDVRWEVEKVLPGRGAVWGYFGEVPL